MFVSAPQNGWQCSEGPTFFFPIRRSLVRNTICLPITFENILNVLRALLLHFLYCLA